MEFVHKSVLLEEVIEGLAIKPEGIYVDGTVGGAGHSSEIAKRLKGKGRLYCFDQDPEALAAAEKRLELYKERVTLIRANFENAVGILKERGETGVDGILLDLGVSSYQLDNGERGFSYRSDAPLDMRMDPEAGKSAGDIVNSAEEGELFRILRDYGEERFAGKIARSIVEARKKQPIKTTFELNAIIKSAIPAKMRQDKHPSKRSFQALRIACNRELEVLEASLEPMIGFLNEGGRFCVISFHSLEDRIVKSTFRREEHPCTCPPDFPKCVCGKQPKGFCVNRKAIVAGDAELEENERAHSAKLRIFEKKTSDGGEQ
ncbi:MAG: 16S rRNA (cytosine(1402)-N(4))-methyltransferase RsmH [Lachnospiraceae bacterium]|nr:16S rRNA (cytosine(1402)-N(4))-methyltransferase RsmH [Lachnospiraceae bacterium]